MIDRTQDGPLTLIEHIDDGMTVSPGTFKPYSLLKRPAVTVIVFAFDAGATLREHTAPVPVLLQVRSGRLNVTANGQTVELGPDGLIYLEAELPHSVTAIEQSRLQLTVLGTGH
jgi:quercetin dioxygenase-like cupin family protein